MPAPIYALILGLVQGATEFLPISSSGHLVLAGNLLGVKEPDLVLDTVLHCGTLLAVVVFLRAELKEIVHGVWRIVTFAESPTNLLRDDPGVRWLTWMVVASVPTALIGVLLKDWFESLFASTLAVGIALCFTGFVLLATQRVLKQPTKDKPINAARAFAVGLAQSIAITPGVSRSGMTIAASLFAGMRVEVAAKFSFLISIPAIFGALLLQVKDLQGINANRGLALSVGFVAAAISGYLCLRLLFKLLEKRRFAEFGIYCLAVGITAIVYSLINA
ncbi:undecaprenyl-diphosphate phosphatase [bacterium]|nr:undecaprenyl-diphosphate phosphatase [bacterium]